MLSALGGADAQTAGVQSAGEVRRAAEVLVFGCVSAALLYMGATVHERSARGAEPCGRRRDGSWRACKNASGAVVRCGRLLGKDVD